MDVVKTKVLISFAVTVKLICAYVFANAKIWFSHDAAQIVTCSFMSRKFDNYGIEN